ncbi:heme exporter protein A [Nitrosomonas cryotolerans]|uniref:Heme exporter protein A n=1 Tax=Nitrosomonas cryotolerans ATCC 49181 TaxID=1131553 RepID=A0A1N6HXX1_9PROT|nr:cytochrome c biogenesis heme-transporting ATPase CcmA [Nitrosomonas cryotolerans]SFP68990.1 heme exporter protein A [Nitrosomonas cryotolerans]SIO24570.1 heme exporter protein A [Nitrosomonas cryotolerans ATCC 49181]
MLQGSNLTCVRGDRRLFKNINFSLREGELMQVHGPNGSGKTSLLRILCGLTMPAVGEVCWHGDAIRSLGGDYYGVITYIGHLSGTKDDLTVIENLRISSALAGIEISESKAREALEYMGLGGRETLPVKVLSQGQRRRVALARLLVCKTVLWILDEPLAALDVSAVKIIQVMLEQHLAQGGMIVMTTHQEIAISAKTIQQLQLA